MRRIRFDVLIRVLADTVILNCALVGGFVVDYLASASSGKGGSLSFSSFIGEFSISFLLLTPVALITFHAMGFYTKGRAYSGRYKVLVVAQAVTLVFLVFGFLNYFMLAFEAYPRKTLVIAWAFSLFSLVAARVWAYVWRLVVLDNEHRSPVTIPVDSGRSILLIGGAGYIGSALLPMLLEKGYQVRLMDMFIYGHEPIAKFLHHPRLEVVHADFRQVDKVVQSMVGMDTVIHVGAIVGDPACAIDEELTIEINVIATKMIAEVAKGQGISKFVFASTCSVYGASEQILNENSVLNPVSLYARSKIASERVLVQMRNDDFQPVILRFGTIYGLSGRTRFDLVVNLLTAKATVEGKITVFGSDQWRPFVHVEDAASAILAAVDAPAELLADVIFNVGSDEQNYTLGQVGEQIKTLVPNAEMIVANADQDRRNYRVDFRRIRDMLGFRPRWTLQQGIQQVLDALGSGKVTDYRDARYSNVKYLTEEATSELWQVQNGWHHDLLDPKPKPVPASAQARVASATRTI